MFPAAALTAIRNAAAQAQVALATITVTYTNRGTPITGLKCGTKSSGDASMRITVGTRSVEEQRTFFIPKQTGFPPTDIMVDDTITNDEGDIFRVEKWNNPDDIGAIYQFEGVYEKTKQVGEVGQ